MKKAVSVLVLMGLLMAAFALPAAAGKKKKKKRPPAPVRVERVVEIPFSCPCGISTPVRRAGFKLDTLTGENIGGATIPLDLTVDKFVSGEVKDDNGQALVVAFNQDTDGDGLNNDVGSFCGKTTEPLPVSDAEAEYRAFFFIGTCDDGTPALATQGTITLTFSNMP